MAENSSDQLELRLGPPGEAADATTALHGGAKRTFHQTKPDDKPWFTLDIQGPKSSSTNTHPPKRSVSSAPVVGWPPIRSCRIKNLASSLNKKGSDAKDKSTTTSHVDDHDTGTAGNELVGDHHDHDHKKQLVVPFIKINMEGIPIGRKINLSAYNSYQELSLAIQQLFATLLAAQGDSPATQTRSNMNVDTKGSSLARGEEYILVYEDDEGDRILVGDVPWNMFVSTAKRLRVLRSSEKTTQSTHSETRAAAKR